MQNRTLELQPRTTLLPAARFLLKPAWTELRGVMTQAPDSALIRAGNVPTLAAGSDQR